MALQTVPKVLSALQTTDEFQNLQKNISLAIQESKAVVVFSETDIDKAGFYIKKFSQLKKELEDRRTLLVKPMNDEVKSINTFFKSVTEKFDAEEKRLRKESNEVLADIERKRQERAKQEQKDLEDQLIKEAEMFDDMSVLDNAPKIEYKHEKPQSSNVTSARVKKWRVVDFDKIDRKYLIVDAEMMDALRKESDYDITSQPIEGIEFYSEMMVRVK